MAAPDTTNPYAAPSDLNGPATGPSDLWQIDGIGLLVAHGAVLPKIDLESGREDPALVEVRRKFTKVHWSMGFMAMGPTMFQFIPKTSRRWEGVPPWILPMVFMGLWLIICLVVIFTLTRRFSFTTYVRPVTEARRRRNRNIHIALYILSMAVVISPMGYGLASSAVVRLEDSFIFVLVGLIGVIATSLWHYLDRPKIRMTLEASGWLRLAGVHFNAIRRLEDWREETREAP
jgi:hypothetical protein